MGAAALLDDERQRLTDAIAAARENPRSAVAEANAVLADLRAERRSVEALVSEVKRLRDIDVPALITAEVTKALAEGEEIVLERMLAMYERAAREAFDGWLREQGPQLLSDRFAEVTPDVTTQTKRSGLRLPPPADPKAPKVDALPPITATAPPTLAIDYRPPYGPCTLLFSENGKVFTERAARHLTDGTIKEERVRGVRPRDRADVECRFSDGVILPVEWLDRTARVFMVPNVKRDSRPSDHTIAVLSGAKSVKQRFYSEGEIIHESVAVFGKGNQPVDMGAPPDGTEWDRLDALLSDGEWHTILNANDVEGMAAAAIKLAKAAIGATDDMTPEELKARGLGDVGECTVEYLKGKKVVASNRAVHHGAGAVSVYRDSDDGDLPEHDKVRVRYPNGEVHDLTPKSAVSNLLRGFAS